MSILIAPSILSANFANLASSIQLVENDADLLHIDVMDGHYVPNLTIGPAIVRAIRQNSKLFFETHLMVKNPDLLLEEFIEAGSDRIVVHPETCPHLHKTLTKIKSHKVQTGLAINPSEDINICNLEYLGELIDSVTIMSVNPGFPAQKFIKSSILKIKNLRQKLSSMGLNCIQIEVDGGINSETATSVIEAGANILVAGNAVYNANNPIEAIKSLRKEA